MRVTVCQLPNDRSDFTNAWRDLQQHIAGEAPDLVLLPEMIASTWFPAGVAFDAEIWQQVLAEHASWLQSLPDLQARCVIGAGPAQTPSGRHIEVFRWDPHHGAWPIHYKRFLPEEPGWHETTWFDRPPMSFEPIDIAGAKVGVLSCTEIFFNEWARHYGHQGTHLIVTPRATGPGSVENWLLAGRLTALVSGSYSASSNRSDQPGRAPMPGQPAFGGVGWVIDPKGQILARTSVDQPFVTVSLDLNAAQAAKSNYPCYIAE